MFDIVVIGAGVSGSAFCRFIDKKYKILLVDRRNITQKTTAKTCGGLLSERGQKAMLSLGLELPSSCLAKEQVFGIRAIDFDSNKERFYQKRYFNFKKEEFDYYLLEKSLPNIDFREEDYLKSAQFQKDHIKLELKSGTIKTKFLVSAEGASSMLRRHFYKPCSSYYTAIQEEFKSNKDIPYHLASFDSKVTDFYSWIIPKDGRLLVGSALADQPNEKFELLKKSYQKLGLIDDIKPLKRTGAIITRPSHKDVYLGKNNLAFIGESAGLISPSSAEGISYALLSGYFLADSLNKGFSINNYLKKTNSFKRSILKNQIKSHIMYSNFWRSVIFSSGLLSTEMNIVK